jgi:hypothetical protein
VPCMLQAQVCLRNGKPIGQEGATFPLTPHGLEPWTMSLATTTMQVQMNECSSYVLMYLVSEQEREK